MVIVDAPLATTLALELESQKRVQKPVPKWKTKTMLTIYLFIFGVLLPAIFIGVGPFIICPFVIPNGWNDTSYALSQCSQHGAWMVAVLYVVPLLKLPHTLLLVAGPLTVTTMTADMPSSTPFTAPSSGSLLATSFHEAFDT